MNKYVVLTVWMTLAGYPLLLVAESHWDNRVPGRAYLFRDTKARCVGDLVTIVITEQTDVQNRENRQLQHETDEGGGLNFASEADGGFGTQGASALLNLGGNSDREMDGVATFRSNRQFEDRRTVVVTEVLPNGNLVIEGRHDIVILDEHRTLCISGVIRPIDIGPDNAISSAYVTDLQLQYTGDGSDSRQLRQGWWSRRWNRINPF